MLSLTESIEYAVGSPGSATVMIADDDQPEIIDRAVSEITVEGSVTSGSLLDTHASDGVYEAIRERQTGGKPTMRRSLLDHRWTFDVTGGNTVIFSVEAYHTVNGEDDDFVFQYSIDDQHYADMVTVNKTADDDAAQSCQLPVGTTGTVFVRVIDKNQTAGNPILDTIYVDDMFIVSS